MYLIIGLGNPGIEYEKTRHNMGFQTIDIISKKYNINLTRQKFEGIYGEGFVEKQKIMLLKPQTYMNLSGKCISQFVQFYKIPWENILIIYDDMDILPGTIKIRKQGGPGSHNGMKSVVQELNCKEFPRIRIGIGKPENKEEMVSYVIGKVEKEEWNVLEKGIETAAKAINDYLINGIDYTMNTYN